MKKIFLTISIMAGLMMTACVKESANEQMGIPEGAILLTTEGFQGHNTKTSVSGTSVQWVSGDKVDIYIGSANNTGKTVAINGSGSAYINTTLSGTGIIRGYYPASTLAKKDQKTDNPSVVFPSTYECSVSAGRQIIALPMAARADESATVLEFRHLTAAINVMMDNPSENVLYVDSVIVMSDSYMLSNSGYTSIDLTKTDFDYSPTTTGAVSSRRVKVSFASPFEVGAGSSDKCIQVPILPIGTDNITIKVYCRNTTTRYIYSHKASTPALARNELLTAKVLLQTGAGHYMESTNIVWVGTLLGDITAMDGDIFKGTANIGSVITIPSGATVTLQGVTSTSISKTVRFAAQGNATIKIEGINSLWGTANNSAIWVKDGSTITIEENTSGTLSCTGGGNAAAIGSGYSSGICGNILIKSGTINATGGANSPGIGSGAASYGASTCRNITIQGGTVTAEGSTGAAGIGTGNHASCICGTITIEPETISTSVSVTAKKGGDGAIASIGKGNENSTCGTVTIGGVGGEITTSPYTYTYPTAK